jgi:hypothetical protein
VPDEGREGFPPSAGEVVGERREQAVRGEPVGRSAAGVPGRHLAPLEPLLQVRDELGVGNGDHHVVGGVPLAEPGDLRHRCIRLVGGAIGDADAVLRDFQPAPRPRLDPEAAQLVEGDALPLRRVDEDVDRHAGRAEKEPEDARHLGDPHQPEVAPERHLPLRAEGLQPCQLAIAPAALRQDRRVALLDPGERLPPGGVVEEQLAAGVAAYVRHLPETQPRAPHLAVQPVHLGGERLPPTQVARLGTAGVDLRQPLGRRLPQRARPGTAGEHRVRTRPLRRVQQLREVADGDDPRRDQA